jgi:hypothetical protein
MPADPEQEQDRPLIGNPHEIGWFWRLLGLHARQSHSVQLDMDHREDFKAQEMAQEWWKRQFKIAGTRAERYRIFEEMDSNGLISSVLDLYSEETTQPDYDRGRSVWIESASEDMRKAGEECLRNIMIEDRLPALVRRMCKYGDGFQRLIYQGSKGVLGWQYCPTDKVHRVEDKYGRVVGFRQDGVKYRANSRTVSWPWDYVHFRLLGKDEDSGYGTALLDSAFSPWRALTLAEDSVLMYRMRRAPDRNLILVDVGNMEEGEAMDYTNQFKKIFRKNEFIDPASPQYRKQYNPLTPMEDIFLPMRGDQNATRVESLSGAGNANEIFDLEYLRDKFFGSVRIPKAYMGFEGDINAKATLTQQDVRFARGCKRVQKAAIYGVRQVCDMHYTLLNNGNDKYDFSRDGMQYLVKMSPISFLDEFERLELIQMRLAVIEAMSQLGAVLKLDPKVWTAYILVNYAKLPEAVVLRLMRKAPESTADAAQEMTAMEALRDMRLGRPVTDERKEKAYAQLNEGYGTAGYYNISAKEQKLVAEAIHASPRLRQIVGTMAEVHIDDLAAQQTDPSMLPPTFLGEAINDGIDESDDVKQLNEDMRALKATRSKLLTEDKK